MKKLPMIIEKLRESTKAVHAALDAWLFPKFLEIDSTEKYARVLKAFYGYYMPVMQMVDQSFTVTYLPDYFERRKPSAILNDLAKIQQPSIPIKYATKLPGISNASQAFGALYVLEGSSLGGVFLSKIIAKNICIDQDGGLSFFYGYGDSSREKWASFIQHLNVFADDIQHDQQAIASAAVETFYCFKHHLEKEL